MNSIHLIAIGGTGMAPLACLLQAEGYQVSGSDGPLYPPMSTLLRDHGIAPLVGFEPAHLDPPPDLVIVGNAVPRTNPQAIEAERQGLPLVSMPEALATFFLGRRQPLVVAGTHGKTTTSSLAAYVYDACGRDPGYLIGGWPHDLDASFARGSGTRFIVEGDEYNAAYFDRGPKFLHYRPQTLILTGVEHDHVDLYPDPSSFRAAFAELVELLPSNGLLVADGDAEDVRSIATRAKCPVLYYGMGADNDLKPIGAVDWGSGATRFRVKNRDHGAVDVELGLAGEHNLRNALAVWAVACHDGLPVESVQRALRDFRGVRRRMEEVGSTGGALLIDDFAHHPTEIEATLEALRQKYPGRRLIAIFEPRSLTAGRSFFFDAYLRAFAAADLVLLAPIYHFDRLSAEERIDLDSLAEALEETGTKATTAADIETLVERARVAIEPGDVVVTMSSGPFEDLPRRLAQAT